MLFLIAKTDLYNHWWRTSIILKSGCCWKHHNCLCSLEKEGSLDEDASILLNTFSQPPSVWGCLFCVCHTSSPCVLKYWAEHGMNMFQFGGDWSETDSHRPIFVDLFYPRLRGAASCTTTQFLERGTFLEFSAALCEIWADVVEIDSHTVVGTKLVLLWWKICVEMKLCSPQWCLVMFPQDKSLTSICNFLFPHWVRRLTVTKSRTVLVYAQIKWMQHWLIAQCTA